MSSSAAGVVVSGGAWPAYNLFYRLYYDLMAGLVPLETMLSVATALFAGLGMVAPLVPRLATGGLRTRRGLLLAAAIVGFHALTGPYFSIAPYGGWPVPFLCTLIPAQAGMLFALWLFDREMSAAPPVAA